MSEIKIGKFIIYEGIFRDRFIVREVVGGTDHYWQVLNPRHSDQHPHRVKKSTIGHVGVFDDKDSAVRAAGEINEKLAKAKADFDINRERVLSEICSAQTTS